MEMMLSVEALFSVERENKIHAYIDSIAMEIAILLLSLTSKVRNI
jgi:hypothetical protein